MSGFHEKFNFFFNKLSVFDLKVTFSQKKLFALFKSDLFTRRNFFRNVIVLLKFLVWIFFCKKS